MNFKVCIALFVTLLAVKASSQTPLEAKESKEVIATVLEEVLKVGAAILNKVRKIVDDIKANEEAIKAKLVNFAINLADKANIFVLTLIDELKDGATRDGKAIIDCIEAEEPKANAAIEKFAKSTGDCLGDETNIVLYEADIILNQVDDLLKDVKGVADKLRDCPSANTICLLEFAQGAAGTLQKLAPVVKGDIEVLRELVETIRNDVAKCGLREELRKGVQEIFNDAVVCINN